MSSVASATGWTSIHTSSRWATRFRLSTSATRRPTTLSKRCQSRVWLNAEYRDGKIHFAADSDAIIVKGIISMLVRVLSDQTPADILDANLYFIDSIGLTEHLSPTRSNGLLAMVKQIKMYALAYKTKEQQQQ